MNAHCLFRPLDRRLLLHKHPLSLHCTFQVITAHFVHHCMLKQALPGCRAINFVGRVADLVKALTFEVYEFETVTEV